MRPTLVHERKRISSSKAEFNRAVKAVIANNEHFSPQSFRQSHYQLLNYPPLIDSAKPHSQYRNDLSSYRALIDLVTGARHQGPHRVNQDK
jgi:hypothetical protein